MPEYEFEFDGRKYRRESPDTKTLVEYIKSLEALREQEATPKEASNEEKALYNIKKVE